MATTLGWGTFPFQFYDMQTRIMSLIAIVGLVIIYFGSTTNSKTITLIGIALTGIGFLGAVMALRNKRGMGFLRRL